MPIDITNKNEKQIALTGVEIEETLLQAHLSKDAVDKIVGLQATAINIDDTFETCKEKVSMITDAFTTGYYLNAPSGTITANASYSYLKIDYVKGKRYFVTNYLVAGVQSMACYYDSNNLFLGYENRGVDGLKTKVYGYELTIPANTAKIGFTYHNTYNIFKLETASLKKNMAIELNKVIEKTVGEWEGKSIVWFGTSIPAGAGTNAYPIMVGEDLGATVTNEAVGSSMARNGSASLVVSGSDPYGWTGRAWQNIAYCLSATIAEKQYLIDNWASWKTKLSNTPPDTLTDTQKAFFLDCSYENKLKRHLGANKKDLYIFDHGHNDNFTDITTVPTNEYDRGYFIGAMNFLVNEILTDNPKAKICFIGHYENARKTDISTAQATLAEIHDFPFLKLWSKLGWTQRTVLVSGVSKTFTQIWMPDNLHPHSDTTGGANQKIASYIVPFIQNEVR